MRSELRTLAVALGEHGVIVDVDALRGGAAAALACVVGVELLVCVSKGEE